MCFQPLCFLFHNKKIVQNKTAGVWAIDKYQYIHNSQITDIDVG